MPYLLNLLYLALIVVAAPWLLASALLKGKYRAGLREKFLGLAPNRDGDCPCIWLHAVSMGEVSLLAPLIDEFRGRHSDWQIAISTTTITGYTLARTRYPDDLVFYCPLDFTWAVRRAMARVRPRLLVLAELELWPNLIEAASDAGSKVAVINGRLSDRSYRGYRRCRSLLQRLLSRVELIAAQNPTYAERFKAIGAPNEAVHVTGSLKFDGAQTDRENPVTARLRKLAGFQTDVIFLAGSTQEPEERLALATFRALAHEHPRLRLVIVPRHPERFEQVARLLAASGLCWQKRSQLDTRRAEPQARVLLVDRVGELGSWWGTAEIAYVGGSMGKRNGQNMIEPAAYGAAVSFGPKTHNFRDVVEALLAAKAAVVVHDGEELTSFVKRCLQDPDFAAELGAKARQVVASQLGATRRAADLLDALLVVPTEDNCDRRIAA